ncbi:hypothetical protein [Spirosoma endbachense]|uniref:Uncharacterized protein n=1 Tax=Spirosoma endbachense TaxID=2666025 RepID=A0A6P1W045_9BACT|nr:hypothetical protein [Spirosoma endbachense]QHV97948.1 hypothetical protein GJR95_24360 [Spirosoma endbachense]
MAKNLYYYSRLFGLIIFLGVVSQRQTLGQSKKASSKPVVAPKWRQRPALTFADETAMRQAVFDSAARFVGMTERTNNNDATWIAIINQSNGLPDRAHYCASAFNYCHALNGIRLPVGDGIGMVRSYFSNAKTIIYRRNARGNQRNTIKPKRMDAVSLFYSHIEGIAQDDFDPDEDDRVKCIGFNTTGGKGTKGGCYVNWRKTREIKLIANLLSPYWQKLHPDK